MKGTEISWSRRSEASRANGLYLCGHGSRWCLLGGMQDVAVPLLEKSHDYILHHCIRVFLMKRLLLGEVDTLSPNPAFEGEFELPKS